MNLDKVPSKQTEDALGSQVQDTFSAKLCSQNPSPPKKPQEEDMTSNVYMFTRDSRLDSMNVRWILSSQNCSQIVGYMMPLIWTKLV